MCISFVAMGTRSRVILRRKAKTPIHLWMHWDGYYSGQGDGLAVAILHLLKLFPVHVLQEKVQNLECADLPEESGQNFSAEHLVEFVLGTKDFYNDTCEDIEYEYVIDFEKQFLAANPLNDGVGAILLTFAMLQEGYKPSDFEKFLD